MAKLRIATAAAVAALVTGGMAPAQGASAIEAREVVGDWNLAITPAERDGLDIRVEIDQGDLPLTITRGAGGGIACVLRGRPAPCRIARGRLVIEMPGSSGAARMIFTLAERTRTGFGGVARIAIRLLPIGGDVGAVSMTRR